MKESREFLLVGACLIVGIHLGVRKLMGIVSNKWEVVSIGMKINESQLMLGKSESSIELEKRRKTFEQDGVSLSSEKNFEFDLDEASDDKLSGFKLSRLNSSTFESRESREISIFSLICSFFGIDKKN